MSRALMTVGYARPGYGYGRVLNALGPRLATRFRLTHVDVGAEAEVTWAERVYPAPPLDLLGLATARRACAEVSPDVVLVVCGPDEPPRYVEALRPATTGALVVYCPIDGRYRSDMRVDLFDGLDLVLTTSEFGKAAIEEVMRRGSCRVPVHVVPHGVDGGLFMLTDRASARRHLFGDEVGAADFVVLNANRNTPRKRVDLTIAGFAQFARDKADVRLCLHMGVSDGGPNVVALARREGIYDRLLLTTRARTPPERPDAELALLFAACDVGLNTSGGEGWGLVAFEHAATGAPQIVPDHSACAELWRDAALLVAAGPEAHDPWLPLRFRYVDPRDVAAALERLYRDAPARAELGRRALERARSPALDWDTITRDLASRLIEVAP